MGDAFAWIHYSNFDGLVFDDMNSNPSLLQIINSIHSIIDEVNEGHDQLIMESMNM